ncbi:MAG: choice-of-anchor tandem repeat GloVer-containing protein [Terracidiphilus sp.]
MTGRASAQTLTTLTSFDGIDGANPYAGLVADANGNLLGTTYLGGTANDGVVFEIGKASGGYASAPTTLVNFNGTNGSEPAGTPITLMADANGNLFGTTSNYGEPAGTVFEIVKTSSGYASTPTTLISFNETDGANPFAGLIVDANGDLFGTTYQGGTDNIGTVFEIVKTSSGYASTPTTLVNFNGTNGANPYAGLVADANGNLFGTTYWGGTFQSGTVFEIPKTASGYASTPTILVNFNGTNGLNPQGALIADANGNLFGTTYLGGASGYGTVFEIVKTSSGYASTPTTLITFNGTNGSEPTGTLIADANGNLFGTTFEGGPAADGTVFEIVKTSSGYASTPTTLANFNGANGANPVAGLIADTNGNLFGTTYRGGASNFGTVFELSGSGFVATTPFASFQAGLAITTKQPYSYALVAGFTTSAANTAINPATEPVTVGIANYTLTISAGAFQPIWGAYVYQGTINGVATYALLTPLGGNRYAFAVAGSPENLSTTTNPVTVSLTIGANGSTSQINAAQVP